MEKRLSGYHHNVRSQLDAVAATKLSEPLFSNAALLVEGTSDKAVLEGLAEESTVTSLLSRGITVVDMGGKHGVMLAHAILSELGVPCYAVFDGNKGNSARMRRNG
ncbi:ATP-dependent endonuclease [Actinosynnema sp. NPDC049800]